MPTPIREKIVNNAASYLRPGEQVQGAFSGQSISGWWSLLTYLMIFWLRFRAVIVTDQRILVLDTGKWSATKPKGVVAELPRNVVIGPASGLWWKCLTLGEKLFVHRRFHKDVLAADTLLAQSGQPVQQIPLGGSQAPTAGQYAGPAGPPPQHAGQQGLPQQYGQPEPWAQPGQPQGQSEQWAQPGQPQGQSEPWAQPGQPQQYGGSQQWSQPAQPQPQQWSQPAQPPQYGDQRPGQQAQPGAYPQDPRFAEPDEDNRTRIRPAPRTPESGPDRPEA